MKKKSISLTLNIRYWSSVIYYFCMMCYGIMIITFYGTEDIGIVYGLLTIFSFIIALLCIMVKTETLLSYADPININNRRRYSIILLIESTEIIMAFVVANSPAKSYAYVIGYCAYVTLIFLISKNIHAQIISDYQEIKSNSKFNDIMDCYLSAVKCDMDININVLFGNFIKFMIYIISLVFVYKFTLYNWLFTVIFAILNIYVLWKLHWTGIKNLVKYKYLYFGVVCFISSAGIVLLKLIHDKVIYVSIFKGRDVQEYLMILVLFFLPLIYYGSKISVIYINKSSKWVE